MRLHNLSSLLLVMGGAVVATEEWVLSMGNSLKDVPNGTMFGIVGGCVIPMIILAALVAYIDQRLIRAAGIERPQAGDELEGRITPSSAESSQPETLDSILISKDCLDT